MTGTTRPPGRPWSTRWSTTPLAALGVVGRHRARVLGAGRPSTCLALVAGQDVDQGDDGVFRIVRGRGQGPGDLDRRHRGPPRPQVTNRHFDGYKAHLSVDPDSELIDEVIATPANTPDRDAVRELLAGAADDGDKPEVVGDSAYADGATRARPARPRASLSRPSARRCATPPAGSPRTASGSTSRRAPSPARPDRPSPSALAATAAARPASGPLRTCPLRVGLHHAHEAGRTITIHPHEAMLQRARAEQRDPAWRRALPGRPAHRRTQDRPLRPPGLGRTTSPHPRPGPHRHRPRHPRRRPQLGPSGRPRPAP